MTIVKDHSNSVIANRVNQLVSSGIRVIFNKAKALEQEGKKVYHFEIGRPDFSPPKLVQESLVEAVKEQNFFYQPNRGTLKARQIVCQELSQQYSLTIDPEDMVFTCGASEAVANCILGLIEEGDEVIIPTPAWPHYSQLVKFAGGQVKEVTTKSDNGYVLKVEDVQNQISKKTKLLVINNPSNPTGALLSEEIVCELVELAKQNDFIIIFDEIYDNYFNTQSSFPSILKNIQNFDNIIYLNGFSKNLSMTGLRLGYFISNKELTNQLNKVHQYFTVCANSLSMRAIEKSWGQTEVISFLQEKKQEYKERLALAKSVLGKVKGLKIGNPQGAMYIFVEYPESFGDDVRLCSQVLEECGVALVPGSVFGESYTHHFRLAYTCSLSDLKEGLEKLSHFFERSSQ